MNAFVYPASKRQATIIVMVRPMLQRCALLVLVVAAACGRADTFVLGGFFAGNNVPPVFFDTVHSAISGEVTLTDPSGQPSGTPLSVVVLSSVSGLCDKIKANPGYFRAPTESFVALALYAPLNKSGTFFVGRQSDNGTNGEVITTAGTSDAGVAPASVSVFAVNTNFFLSQVRLSEFALREPGNARGGFDLVFPDQSSVLHEVTGQFKTNVCNGFDKVLLP